VPHPFARHEADEEPKCEVHLRARDELVDLVRVRRRLRLLIDAPDLRHPATRKRVHLHEPHGLDGEREHAVHELRNVTSRRLR
jgi:hypothetical protein